MPNPQNPKISKFQNPKIPKPQKIDCNEIKYY